MKILLSAYACEPDQGSEPGVGWNWVVELAKAGHDIWVLTRAAPNKTQKIKMALQTLGLSQRVQVEELDFSPQRGRLYENQNFPRMRYYLWQWLAYRRAKALHREIGFDVVHHVTWVSARQPSFMGLLGIPFIFGPVAGGESSPLALRKVSGLKAMLSDCVRDVVNFCVRFDPSMHLTSATANKVYVTSEQTKNLIPSRYHDKTSVKLAIGIENHFIGGAAPRENENAPLKFLYVGQLLGLKGVELAIRAFAQHLRMQPDAKFTIVGSGPDEQRLRQIAKTVGCAESITWTEWKPQQELIEIYDRHDVFLFPSTRDSGGLVVLEAMARGLPVVCLKIGGPGVIVNEKCGYALNVKNQTINSLVQEFAGKLADLERDRRILNNLSHGALSRVKDFRWSALYEECYARLIKDKEHKEL